jgi:hypothetical protein
VPIKKESEEATDDKQIPNFVPNDFNIEDFKVQYFNDRKSDVNLAIAER